jgi:hypothetical protein
MAYLIPEQIPLPPSEVTASYDYVDLADGVGYVTYYCTKEEISGSVSYGLTRDTGVYSVYPETSGSATLDIDFDVSAFNQARTVKGTAIYNGAHVIDGNQAGGNQKSWFRVLIRKWDGSTETEIADAYGPTVTVAGQTTSNNVLNIPITVPQTTFGKGEQLRVTVQHILSGGTTTDIFMGHDPKNRDGDWLTAAAKVFTASSIKIPFMNQF